MTPWRTFVNGLPQEPKPKRQDPIRLVCFDLDGVLVEQESSWVTVHKHFGLDNENSLADFLQGTIDDAEFIRRDVALWKSQDPSISLEEIERILKRNLTLTPGAQATISVLQKAGVSCAIVSGGIHLAAQNVAKKLGILLVSANELLTDPHGKLTGESIVHTPLRNKAVPLRRFAKGLGLPLGQVASVGNSSPDIGMFRTSGMGVAFRPTDEFVQTAADAVVAGPDLRQILDPILKPT